ncbi:UDP-Glycosyltransferase/glycogen phosphorylase [Meredithblackwellia eburnea MCA 4105]
MSTLRTALAPPPPRPRPTLNSVPSFIGAQTSLVDLLQAAAHDPDQWEQTDTEEDEDDDELDTTSSSEAGDSAIATPSELSLEHDHDDPHVYPHHPDPPVRGASLLLESEFRKKQKQDVLELALDGIDSNDDAIYRTAQAGRKRAASIAAARAATPAAVNLTQEQAFPLNVPDRVLEEDEETFDDPKDDEDERSPEDRLLALEEEFGKWQDGSEEFVATIPGALYRGVLVKGLLGLTNRRFFIFAYVPRQEPNKPIRAGSVTVHIPGPLSRKRRVWIELKSDSASWYKSSETTYRPIGSCRLSQLKVIHPYNPEEPRFIRFELIDGRTRWFELDTAEAALAWRGDFEAAVYTFRSTADKLRLSLPLQLIQEVLHEPYLSLAERVQVMFDSGKCADTGISGDDDASIISSDSGSGSGTGTGLGTEKRERTLSTIEFGFLKNHHHFVEKLENLVLLAKDLSNPCAVPPILELDSDVRKLDLEKQKEVEEDNTLAAKFCRTFALDDKPSDLFVAPSCELVRSLPTWGSLVVSQRFLCFWRRGYLTSDVKLRIPLTDIDDVGPSKAWGFRIVGLAVQLHGAPDVRLDFHSRKMRDAVIDKIKESVLVAKAAALAISTGAASKSFGGSLSDSSSGGASYSSSPRTPATTPPVQLTASPIATPSLSSGAPGSPLTPSSASIASGTTNRTSTTSSTVSAPPYVISPVKLPFQASLDRTVLLGQKMEEHVSVPAGLPANMVPKVIGTIGVKQVTGLHFICLTIGSRGDVQPYVSLARELMKDGNRVTIASHPEYRSWVEGFGIGYQEVGGDPAALMKLSVEHKMFSPGFFKESLGHFRQWLDDLFAECWAACQDADILIESPSTMAGIHVAEGLGIPYFRAFTMPWTATATYPQAFAASVELGPTYNQLSYTLFDSVIWKAISGQVNRFRKNTMGIQPTNMHKMSAAKTPFIYNFSSAVCPRPIDYKDWIYISGYWFLDDERPWTPQEGLLEFIEKAREDGKPVIYVGFGSIVVPDAQAVTKAVVAAVKNADVRAILSKGWSDRGAEKPDTTVLPPEIFSVSSIPHDRLFPLIDAACHHGGAGTTGASLRAGLPTLIHPFFGDQYFWASRVQKLGTGVKIDSLSEKDLTAAFKQGTSDRIMKEKAGGVGERIRAENGPRNALNFIYDHIHLAQERADLRAARARGGKPDRLKEGCFISRTLTRAGTPIPKTGGAGSPARSPTPTRGASIATTVSTNSTTNSFSTFGTPLSSSSSESPSQAVSWDSIA